jgi:hypothetical protein
MTAMRDSIWWSGLVFAGMASSSAWADPAHEPISPIIAADYQLPSPQALTLSPSTTALVPEYGALAELKTTAAQTMAAAGRTAVIPGPDLSYRAGERGPLVEIGALGGGMDKAPGLAHVGVDWIF